MESVKYKRMREKMVKSQLEARGITDSRVLNAFYQVPRQLFVSEAMRDRAYSDHPLPIGEGQTISQPYIVAEMLQALNLDKDDRVLEIGTGSGYQTALLSAMVYRVYTIECIYSLYVKARKVFDDLKYHNIVTRRSDGSSGWPSESPFDAIIVSAGAREIPVMLINQLETNGRMILPVGNQRSQELILLSKDEDGIAQQRLGRCVFVNLVGEYGWEKHSIGK